MKQSANIFGNTLAKLPSPVFQDAKHRVKIFQGDCLEILALVPDNCVDLIFADPPYFLSNDGITCHAGRCAHAMPLGQETRKGEDCRL